jgi:transcriptional regulator with XRE-family HTH domain
MTEPIEPCHRAVGARVEQIRKMLGKTQDDIAKTIGLTRASVANIETGRQRLLLHTVEDLAQALGTTPKHLMRGIWL